MKRLSALLISVALLLGACTGVAGEVPSVTNSPSPAPISPPAATALPIPTVAATVPAESAWVGYDFAPAWVLALPADWQMDSAGAREGALAAQGVINGRNYLATFHYPLFEQMPASLEAWVEQEIRAAFPAGMRPSMSAVTIAGVPAKRISAWPTSDGSSMEQVFIWSGNDRNPRRISIAIVDGGPPDPAAMDGFVSRMLASIE
jgi:hypothetical protein